jgi:hypothetical protein
MRWSGSNNNGVRKTIVGLNVDHDRITEMTHKDAGVVLQYEASPQRGRVAEKVSTSDLLR